MSYDIAISVRNLTKTYRIFNHPGDRIKQAFTFGRVRFHKEFTALKNVSFEIKKGETVGIIGRNGSGKSTLLQLICGILKPTSGSVTVNGRISALLELGSGFNPEFTGRENIYFQGAIMGFTKEEMDAKVEEIIAFADIGEFINQPVRTYSSGMFVRLAFATAIHSEPDLLVVDEALAVGDAGFQQKCLDRIQQMHQSNVTIFMVAHDLMLLRSVADTLIYLKGGQVQKIGDPEMVGEMYLIDINKAVISGFLSQAQVNGKDESLLNRIHRVLVSIRRDELLIYIEAMLSSEISKPEVVIQIRDARGYVIYGRHASRDDISLSRVVDGHVKLKAILKLNFGFFAGSYAVSASLNSLDASSKSHVMDKRVGIATFHAPVASNATFHGCINLNGEWMQPDSSELAEGWGAT